MTFDRITFSISRIPFDEEYYPADGTRITTNFANLARGDSRRENLRNTLRMIDNRFNSLMPWDNAAGDRYAVKLFIVSAALAVDLRSDDDPFPLIENATNDGRRQSLRRAYSGHDWEQSFVLYP